MIGTPRSSKLPYVVAACWVVTASSCVRCGEVREKTLSPPNGALDGRWYWLASTPDGKVVVMDDAPVHACDLPECASYHDLASANDFVFLHSFR